MSRGNRQAGNVCGEGTTSINLFCPQYNKHWTGHQGRMQSPLTRSSGEMTFSLEECPLGNCPGRNDGKCLVKMAGERPGNVEISMQDYNSPRAAVMICDALVNTHTDSCTISSASWTKNLKCLLKEAVECQF